MTSILIQILTGWTLDQIFGLDTWTAVIIAVILLVVVIYSFLQLRKQVARSKEKTNEHLRHQFKEGEISKNEFEGKKKDLR